jgi:hypothetical protein
MMKKLGETQRFLFKEVTRPKQNAGGMKRCYEISASTWWQPVTIPKLTDEDWDWIRDMCDPMRNKSGRRGRRWRFRSRTEAERCWTMILLKFGT